MLPHLRKEGVERRLVDDAVVARAELDDARRRAGQQQAVALRDGDGAVALELERKLHRLLACDVLRRLALRVGRRRRARRCEHRLHLGRVRRGQCGRRRRAPLSRSAAAAAAGARCECVVGALGGARGDQVVRAQRGHVRLGVLAQLGERRLARL